MKQPIILLLILSLFFITVIRCASNYDFSNPVYDEDRDTAPALNARFDVSQLSLVMEGREINIPDDFSPSAINAYPSDLNIDLETIYNNVTKEIYIKTGNSTIGSHFYSNQTESYIVVKYTGGISCFQVANYTYDKYVAELRYVRRGKSVIMKEYAKKVNLRDQIDDIYGKDNRICAEKPDIDIFDIYYGTINDIASPGGFSGVQLSGTSHTIYVNRYAQVCYNKTWYVSDEYQLFYPLLNTPAPFVISSRNEFRGEYVYYNFTLPSSTSYRAVIDGYCGGGQAYDYQYFFNLGRPFPEQPCTNPCTLSAKRALGRLNVPTLARAF